MLCQRDPRRRNLRKTCRSVGGWRERCNEAGTPRSSSTLTCNLVFIPRGLTTAQQGNIQASRDSSQTIKVNSLTYPLGPVTVPRSRGVSSGESTSSAAKTSLPSPVTPTTRNPSTIADCRCYLDHLRRKGHRSSDCMKLAGTTTSPTLTPFRYSILRKS